MAMCNGWGVSYELCEFIQGVRIDLSIGLRPSKKVCRFFSFALTRLTRSWYRVTFMLAGSCARGVSWVDPLSLGCVLSQDCIVLSITTTMTCQISVACRIAPVATAKWCSGSSVGMRGCSGCFSFSSGSVSEFFPLVTCCVIIGQ